MLDLIDTESVLTEIKAQDKKDSLTEASTLINQESYAECERCGIKKTLHRIQDDPNHCYSYSLSLSL